MSLQLHMLFSKVCNKNHVTITDTEMTRQSGTEKNTATKQFRRKIDGRCIDILCLHNDYFSTAPSLSSCNFLSTFACVAKFSGVLWFVESAANVGSMHSSCPDPLLGAVKAHRNNPAKTGKNHGCTKCRFPMRHLLSSHNPRTPVRHVSGSASQPRGP